MTTQNLKLPDKGKGHEIDGVVFSKKKIIIMSKIKQEKEVGIIIDH